MIRWPKSSVSVAFVELDHRLNENRRKASEHALDNAIAEINGTGSGIRLVRAVAGTPDIQIYLSAESQVSNHVLVRKIAGKLGRRPVGISRIFFKDHDIYRALVVVAANNQDRELTSVMLEEIVQSLGLPTDIRNSNYSGRSIFSETGNRTIKLRGQDAKALNMHYPPL